MRKTRFGAYSGPLFLQLLVASTLLSHAQELAPASGAQVVVKMTEAVDSSKDPAGKQYRASVTKAVDAGNGVTIPQGAVAAVTLVQSGSGWTTQLVSVTINGQPVAVTSGSASVTSAAQSAAGNAVNSINSVLGGFGHHVNAPAAAAVATGQRVVLPPGATLTFVLSQPPAANPAAPAAPTSQPLTASAAPISAASAGGPLTAMEICFSNPPPTPSDPNHKTEYLTAVFEVPVDSLHAIPALEPAFSAYLKATYHYPSAGITCQPIWSIADAQAAQNKIAADRDRAKLKMVNTGWRYGQPPLTQGQSGFDPLAQGPGGLDLSQHRLTTYYCTLTADGGTSQVSSDPSYANRTAYVSPIFQADWDSTAVNKAWYAYIRDHYVHDLSQQTFGPGSFCLAQSPAMAAMMHSKAGVSKLIHHIVAVDWTDTSAQAAQASATASAGAAHTPAHPTPATAAASSGGPFISCSTSGGAGIDTYLTGVFQTTLPVKHLPSGGNLVDQSVLDRFYAYLKQKGYNFKPGSNYGCDVSPTEAQAKAAQHKRAYEGGACSTCGKIVETGWKDSSN